MPRMLLLLLLPLFVSLHPASSANMCRLHEVTTNVKDLGQKVKNCSENCSSVHITDKRCMCLNLNVSQEECASFGYFIKGLQSLHPDVLNEIFAKQLINAMNRTLPRCYMKQRNFCSLPVKLSPKTFHKELEDLVQQIRSSEKPTERPQ